VRAAPACDAAFPARTAQRRRRSNSIWIAVAAVILVGFGSAGIAFALHDSGPPRKSESTTSAHRPGTQARTTTSARATVRAFIAAINHRDWQRVWQLGGKNLGETRPKLVAGFRYTRHDVITSIVVSHGDVVTAQVRAYETTGVQTITLRYTVRGGIITQGTVVRTQNAAGNQSG
jgi:hypothetical protein